MIKTVNPTPAHNPFTILATSSAAAFYGRKHEIEQINLILNSETPFSCSIVGETYIGKTSLLCYLSDQVKDASTQTPGKQDSVFVYFDAELYRELATGDYASVQFWWDMWQVLQRMTIPHRSQRNARPILDPINVQVNPVDIAHEYRSKCEKLLADQKEKRIIIMLDNFEGIASLPVRDSAWLRALIHDCNCIYIAASRYPLELLYHPGSWGKLSPLWNVFYPQSIRPGLLEENDVVEFIYRGDSLRDFWDAEDVCIIKEKAGRHPALLRLLCELFYRKREELNQQHQRRKLKKIEIEHLDFLFYKDASIICDHLWHGLADPELMGVSRPPDYQRDMKSLSLHQKALLQVIQHKEVENIRLLFNLEQRGLVERKDGTWQVFAEVMKQFLVNLAEVQGWTDFQPVRSSQTAHAQSFLYEEASSTVQQEPEDEEHQEGVQPARSPAIPAFTYLEGEVYRYLQEHIDTVCRKNAIKEAIWKKKLPTDSTLQKLIERIRDKIEPNPENPRYLIAVRGQGYILRSEQSQTR